MDPYLEGSLWSSVQMTLSAEIAIQISRQARSDFLALPVEWAVRLRGG
jgi:hypothetical protein